MSRAMSSLPQWLQDLWKVAPNYARKAEAALEEAKQFAPDTLSLPQWLLVTEALPNPYVGGEDMFAWQESRWCLVVDHNGITWVAKMRVLDLDDPDESTTVDWIQRGRDGYECHPLMWTELPEPEGDLF